MAISKIACKIIAGIIVKNAKDKDAALDIMRALEQVPSNKSYRDSIARVKEEIASL